MECEPNFLLVSVLDGCSYRGRGHKSIRTQYALPCVEFDGVLNFMFRTFNRWECSRRLFTICLVKTYSALSRNAILSSVSSSTAGKFGQKNAIKASSSGP